MSDLSLVRFEECASTQTEARKLAESGVEGPLLVLAKLQTAGRGRGGNSWSAPPKGGNVHATLILKRDLSEVQRAWLPLLCCLAWIEVFDARLSSAGAPLWQIKWPNDLLLEGRKIGGQLIESFSPAAGGEGAERPEEKIWLIGSGVNLVGGEWLEELREGQNEGPRAGALDEAGLTLNATPDELAENWARELQTGLAVAAAHRGDEKLAVRVNELLWALGCEVNIWAGKQVAGEGVLLGVGPLASILIKTNSGDLQQFHDGTLRLHSKIHNKT